MANDEVNNKAINIKIKVVSVLSGKRYKGGGSIL